MNSYIPTELEKSINILQKDTAVEYFNNISHNMINLCLNEAVGKYGCDSDKGTDDFDNAIKNQDCKLSVILGWQRGIKMKSYKIDNLPIFVYILKKLHNPDLFISVLSLGGTLIADIDPNTNNVTTISQIAFDEKMYGLAKYLILTHPYLKDTEISLIHSLATLS